MTLPWPPSANHAHISNGRGGRVVSSRTRQFRAQVGGYAWERFKGASTPLDAPVEVSIDCFYPNRQRRDLDNLIKQTLDAITHAGIWRDDSLVYILSARRMREIVKGGRLEVTIKTLDDGE